MLIQILLVSLKYEINVSKGAVRLAMLEVDHEGVTERRKKTIKHRLYTTDGPCHIYHIYGNDNLKKWGFATHDRFDGFSRKIMWLTASTTNNEPLFIANLYLNGVKTYFVVPRLLRIVYWKDWQDFFTNDKSSYLCSVTVEKLFGMKNVKLIGGLIFFTCMEKQNLLSMK